MNVKTCGCFPKSNCFIIFRIFIYLRVRALERGKEGEMQKQGERERERSSVHGATTGRSGLGWSQDPGVFFFLCLPHGWDPRHLSHLLLPSLTFGRDPNWKCISQEAKWWPFGMLAWQTAALLVIPQHLIQESFLPFLLIDLQ